MLFKSVINFVLWVKRFCNNSSRQFFVSIVVYRQRLTIIGNNFFTKD